MPDPLAHWLTTNTPAVSERAGWEVATLLVTVKAYPAMARLSGESICVAGVRLDGPQPEWIRLFPIGFRNLRRDQQFTKYQVVRLRVKRGTTDRRPESYKPDLDSLVLGPRLDTDNRTWRRRWEVLDSLVDTSTTCELAAAAQSSGQSAPSLALVKPAVVRGVKVIRNPDFDEHAAREFDINLFGDERELLRAAPLTMHYTYACKAPGCREHTQSLVDWESGQLARRNIGKGFDEAIRLHEQRFFHEIAGADRDLHFFVGNQHQHPQSFLILGCFYPKAGNRPDARLDL